MASSLPSLAVRFDVGTDIGGSFFYDIPRNVTDAVSEGWTLKDQPSDLPVTSVDMYCYSDLIVCTFYDANGDVAGMQVALPVDDFTDNYYDMEETGFTKWTPAVEDGETEVSYWTLQQYFTTEEILSSRKGRATRDNENKIIENGGVWVMGVGKELVQVANTTDELVSGGLFTQQACIPWMGRHYYYNMSSNTSCTDEPLFPWFPIVDSGELIATGFMVFGNLTLDSDARNWFEAPSQTAVEVIVPSGPDCLYELADSPGVVTMHVYYVNEPWLVTCIFQ
ncbi:hypothetical protein MSG28_007098 [Choristoneura fumiferana]|uniref:Uncharacterized protein n=1 Tax=Choristoneura fumiferana TaxID=7141 RepID=A0ACC0JMT5_CHOFU|nr:hypothetical protein MSG28_007098 [Choristoneura fumiferana]